MKFPSKITVLISIIFLAKLVYFGDLNFLIHPRYFILIYLSIALLAIALVFKKNCEHDSQKIYPLALLLLVFIFGIAVDFKPLSSTNQKVAQYQNGQEVPRSTRDKYRTSFNIKTDELSLAELVSVFSVDPEPDKYVGKSVRVSGFYFETGDGSPMIARYKISCCAADAQLIGLWLEKNLQLKPDTWIEVEGTLSSIESSSGRLIAIKVSEFNKIETPENPYVIQ